MSRKLLLPPPTDVSESDSDLDGDSREVVKVQPQQAPKKILGATYASVQRKVTQADIAAYEASLAAKSAPSAAEEPVGQSESKPRQPRAIDVLRNATAPRSPLRLSLFGGRKPDPERALKRAAEAAAAAAAANQSSASPPVSTGGPDGQSAAPADSPASANNGSKVDPKSSVRLRDGKQRRSQPKPEATDDAQAGPAQPKLMKSFSKQNQRPRTSKPERPSITGDNTSSASSSVTTASQPAAVASPSSGASTSTAQASTPPASSPQTADVPKGKPSLWKQRLGTLTMSLKAFAGVNSDTAEQPSSTSPGSSEDSSTRESTGKKE